jgi:serine/threonine-protein kinase
VKQAERLIGAVIDRRFRIEAFVGPFERGGFVFRGLEMATGEPTAIRCPGLPDDLVGVAYEEALDTFVREAKELTRTSESSKDVEQLLAYGIAETAASEAARVPFCVFEWLEGKSLEEHMAERAGASQSLGEALAILEPAARALAAAHAIGVAHKDVRPRNLWLAKVDGRVRMKLTQFVAASRIGGADDAFSPRYGAPEHFKRSYGEVGTYSDVYAFALCLVELVSGRPALEGADAAELYLATSDLAERPTLRARGVQVSDAVEAVLARALAVDPKRRWQTARELWDALVSAVPELTPAAPSIRPRDNTSELPSDDARLAESAKLPLVRPPPVVDERAARSVRRAWMLVLFVGLISTGVVALSLVRAARNRSLARARQAVPAMPSASPSTSLAPSASAGRGDE